MSIGVQDVAFIFLFSYSRCTPYFKGELINTLLYYFFLQRFIDFNTLRQVKSSCSFQFWIDEFDNIL